MMINQKVEGCIEPFLDGNLGDVTLEAKLEPVLSDIFQSFAKRGGFSLTLRYMTSRDNDIYEVEDIIEYDSSTGKLKVTHQPEDSNHDIPTRVFSVSPSEYASRMIYPESTSYIEMEFLTDEATQIMKADIFLNMYQQCLSPMEIEQLPGGSYLTIQTLVPRVSISFGERQIHKKENIDSAP